MKPPYYAVIFSTIQTDQLEGYEEMAQKMEKLVKEQPGYLGMESARETVGITVSYWETLESIRNWKQNFDHLLAQKLGRSTWYDNYRVRICLVERDYSFSKET